MPIYEFECAACGKRFEDLVSLSADPQKVACPECGKTRARKLLSLFATAAKGAGGASACCGSAIARSLLCECQRAVAK